MVQTLVRGWLLVLGGLFCCDGQLVGIRAAGGEDSATTVSHSGTTTPAAPPITPATQPGAEPYVPFPGLVPGRAPTRVWQLTPRQYASTVSLALGTPIALETIQATGHHEDFLNNADGLAVDDVLFSELESRIHELTAARSTYLQAQVQSLGGCAVGVLDRNCLQRFLNAYAPRILRQASPNIEPYLALFATLRTRLTHAQALEGVVAALLLSPKALYRTELGDPTQPSRNVELTPSELAEALSFTLWNEPPDAELMARAADGTLGRPEVLQVEVNRLFGSPKGNAGLTNMLLEWAGVATFDSVEKDAARFPDFQSKLQGPMIAESRAFVKHVLTARSASFKELLTLRDSFAPESLSTFYDIQNGQLPSTRRGLFTQAAVISAMSQAGLNGTVARGQKLLHSLLCMQVAAPDNLDAILAQLPPPEPSATMRETFAEFENQNPCGACHRVLHPMAFAFENYDPVGRYVTHERGKPIIADGSLSFTQLTNQPFQNAVEMIEQLSKSPEVHQCFTRQTFRYVTGRHERASDDPLLASAYSAFRETNTNISTLMRTLVLSSAFRERERP